MGADDWFNKGKKDLETARKLVKGDPQNAFKIARECVELLLKSLLVKQGFSEEDLKKLGHNYKRILEAIDWEKIHKANREIIEGAVKQLVNFEMESGEICQVAQVSKSRYPEDITPMDAERTIQLAYVIYAEIQKEFS